MRVKQLSIFLENQSGRLAEVTGALGVEGINIRALSLADTSGFGILRLIVNDIEKARQVLRGKGFTVRETDVIAVEMPDQPSGLAGILKILGDNGINVEYMYAFVQKSAENAVVVFRIEDIDNAINALLESGVKILSASEVYSI
jgi:hypothetical protein